MRRRLGLIDRLMQTMKDDVVGIVDAAQGRLAPAAYQSALDRGLMVSFTGSKFFGGPPFAGALFVPPSLNPNATGLRKLPAGFEDYFCGRDLPRSWFPLRVVRDQWYNTGSLLRWIAGATEINNYFAIDPLTRESDCKRIQRCSSISHRQTIECKPVEPVCLRTRRRLGQH